MIIFIMSIIIISIGLLGILIVITYTCVTTKSLQSFCSNIMGRSPSPIRYASDDDYAEQARNSKDLDHEFQKSIEFDGDEIQLSATSDDEDEAQMEDCCNHRHSECDCTDDGGDSDDFDSNHRCAGKKNSELLAMNSAGMAGLIV